MRNSHFAIPVLLTVLESATMPTARENSIFDIRRHSTFLLRVFLLTVAALVTGCHTRTNPEPGRAELQTPGEPHNYSATVSRTVDDGAHTEVTVTHIARLGEMLREQWSQDGETLVSIWRPDLGKVFFLSLNQKAYVETDLSGDRNAEAQRASQTSEGPGNGSLENQPSGKNLKLKPEEVDRAFEDEPAPEQVETEELPAEVIDGHSCRIFRQRTVFSGGQVETTKTFRSIDLEGLAIRIESETEGSTGRTRILTERREVKTGATRDQFEIPASFKRVNSLARR